ncbi:hypothetical protein M427DRAFT_52920 [Gonapodya prolifera JEL478]|uniref:SH3 domain-containing protein n=1 Tax=Gonapodya prolifera (strain JEL478) TaxID=1344416 RepID=A0A139ARX2_GONPJ|nr:hypothetical protein M427DRAFT_52920 [Gonapodya prolifera JEL478]|eukprot:KXS19487.1 hypothetical protein M427DRAFT_52920 [Gonapodya prolifera JEL478]
MAFVSCVVADSRHAPTSNAELSVSPGDILWVMEFDSPDRGWARVVNKKEFDEANEAAPTDLEPKSVPMAIFSPLPKLGTCYALYPWTPTHADELALTANELLVVRQQNPGGWWICSKNLDDIGSTGLEAWGVVAENYSTGFQVNTLP